MTKRNNSSSRALSLVFMITFGIIVTVIGYAMYKGGVFSLFSRASSSADVSGVPVASQNETPCQTVSDTLYHAEPLKIPKYGVWLNWGGIKEKWFQDSKGVYYYISPEVAVKGQENPSWGKKVGELYVVRQWKKGLQKQVPEKPLTQSTLQVRRIDTAIAIETKACYDMIAVGYTFPKPQICKCKNGEPCPSNNAAFCNDSVSTPAPTYTIISCKTDSDCPSGYTCRTTPPGGCPSRIVNGIEEFVACAHPPRCYPVSVSIKPVQKCENTAKALSSLQPLKVTNLYYNWGGVYEKWFQDKNGQWYYIYRPSREEKLSTQYSEVPTTGVYIVNRWKGGLSNAPDTMDRLEKDIFISQENAFCFEAIVKGFTFPQLKDDGIRASFQ